MVWATFWTWHGWNALVAIGTLALAGGTFGLAWFTWRVVRESRKQIDLSAREVTAVEKQTEALVQQTEAVRDQANETKRQVAISIASLEAASRPVLVGVVPPPIYRTGRERVDPQLETVAYFGDHHVQVRRDEVHFEESDAMVYCSVPLRNIGAGVAFVQEAMLVTRTEFPGRVSDPVVPRGETTRARFAVVLRQSDGRWTDVTEITPRGRGFAQFKIRLVYTGASRELITVSEITAAQVPDGSFIFTEQQIWDGDPSEGKLLVSTANIG